MVLRTSALDNKELKSKKFLRQGGPGAVLGTSAVDNMELQLEAQTLRLSVLASSALTSPQTDLAQDSLVVQIL